MGKFFFCKEPKCNKKYINKDKLINHALVDHKKILTLIEIGDPIEYTNTNNKKRKKNNDEQKPSKNSSKKKVKRETECAICFTKECNASVIPCGHACFCYECILNYKSKNKEKGCPVCRAEMKDILKLYY
jgi:hypothetical protein